MGHRAIRSLSQTDDLDQDTRTELWNVTNQIRDVLQGPSCAIQAKIQTRLITAVWKWEFKKPVDERPSDGIVWTRIKTTILDGEWYEVLDLIEKLVGYLKRFADAWTDGLLTPLVEGYNDRFRHFLVGYRFIGLEITPIDTTAQADAVAEAIDATKGISGARHAFEQAVNLLSDRQNPDYPNSIKESISAVEAVVKKVTGEGTLGAGLKKLKGAGLSIHPSLELAWSKMYGWTSNDAGIRHGDIEAADADQALAKYVLVTCSVFVSLPRRRGAQARPALTSSRISGAAMQTSAIGARSVAERPGRPRAQIHP